MTFDLRCQEETLTTADCHPGWISYLSRQPDSSSEDAKVPALPTPQLTPEDDVLSLAA